MREPYVNEKLLNRALKAREDMILSGEYREPKDGRIIAANRDLSRLGRVAEQFTEAQMAVVVTVAVKKHPEIVMKAILDELKEGENR